MMFNGSCLVMVKVSFQANITEIEEFYILPEVQLILTVQGNEWRWFGLVNMCRGKIQQTITIYFKNVFFLKNPE